MKLRQKLDEIPKELYWYVHEDDELWVELDTETFTFTLEWYKIRYIDDTFFFFGMGVQ